MMMRLAERLGVSLKQLLSDYTRKELDLWVAWIAKEPSDGQKIEYALANLTMLTFNINSEKQNHRTANDFIYKADWTPELTADVDLLRASLNRR